MIKKGAVTLYTMAGEKRLPGLEKGIYTGNNGMSVYGAAIIAALSGEAAKDDFPNITSDRLYVGERSEASEPFEHRQGQTLGIFEMHDFR